MATFFMLGKYSDSAVKGISEKRTEATKKILEEHGGRLKGGHALLGDFDLILDVELPSVEEALKASILLNKQTGISFSTYPAISIEEFDSLASKLSLIQR